MFAVYFFVDCDSEFGTMRGRVEGVSVKESDDGGTSGSVFAALRAFDYHATGWIPKTPNGWVQVSYNCLF